MELLQDAVVVLLNVTLFGMGFMFLYRVWRKIIALVVPFGSSLRLSSTHAAADEDGSGWPSASRERSRPRSRRVNFQLKGSATCS
jgi:hypothetical protein